MAKIISFPGTKISQRKRHFLNEVYVWEDKGFSREVSCVAASLCVYIDKLERRLNQLEKRKSYEKGN